MSDDSGPGSLSLVVFSGGFDRVHYALVMASAAAATNRRVTLFFTGRALRALLAGSDPHGPPGWHGLDPADDGSAPAERDESFAAKGLATFEELLSACVMLGATVMVCEMGLRALDLPEGYRLRDDGGVVTFLNEAGRTGPMLFV
jgi:peroxiredoxin family protein